MKNSVKKPDILKSELDAEQVTGGITPASFLFT